jgi:uncharacterized protein (TIGR02453 family)
MSRPQHAFPGFPREALPFLRKLEKNNNREWFEARKPVYEEKLKAPMMALVEAANATLAACAPEYIAEPKKAVFRIYRDVRFSKNKDPFKTNIAAGFRRQGLAKDAGASLYLHLDPKEFLVAGGIYMPMPEQLKLLRAHIARTHEEFRAILKDRKLAKLMGALQGDLLARAPKGYLPDDPALDLLRRKMYIFWTSLPPETAESPAVLKEVSGRFRAMAPFLEYLNRPFVHAANQAKYLRM